MTDRRTDRRTDGGDCNIPIAFLKKRGDNKTLWIMIRWLLQKPADPDLQYFQKGLV